MKAYFRSAVLASGGAVLLTLALLGLHAGQTSLKLVSAPSGGPAQFTLRLQMQSTSNSVLYVIQTSTNLIQWDTLVSGKAKPGTLLQVADVSPANHAKFFRVNELSPNLVDTNPPAWTNGVGGTFTLLPPAGATVGWNPATDDIGVAQYAIFLNGVLVTNLSGALLSYQFNLNYQSPADLRIQAADASGNLSPILALVYLPGNEVTAVSDDSGHVYVFNYYQTNALVTNGGFAAPKQIAYFGANDRGLALGDFDRDGILDLVAGYANGNTLNAYFFKGLGDGTFAAPVALPGGAGAVQNSYVMDMTVGDWDGDGNLDVAINGNYSYVVFYWGNGDGTFTPEVKNWADGNYFYGRGMAAGDFNEDGLDDLARATYGSGMVKVFLSKGDRTFIETNLVASGVGDNDPYALAAGDFNGDGHLDLLVGGGGSGHVNFLQGYGDGTFTNLGASGWWTNLNIGPYYSWDAYDYNDDGNLDLVMAANNGRAYYWQGNSDGTFTNNPVTIASGMSSAFGVSAPPRPPRVDVNITPRDPVTNVDGSVTFSAVGTGVSSSDIFRWSFGDTVTNPVAWTFTSASTNMGPTVSHTYTNEGHFLTRLWHTATNGISSVRGTWVIAKGNPPVANPGGPYVYGSQVATQGVWYATLDGSASTDDFGIVRYIWSFGDGTGVTNTVPQASHGWPSNGVYTVSLTVVDASFQSSTASTTITFTNGAPPVAVITGPATVGESNAYHGTWTATFSGTSSTSPVGVWQYAWRNVTTGQTGNSSTFQTTWNAIGTNYVTLLVTANDSQTNQTTYTVVVVDDATPPVPVIQGPQLLSVDVATNGLWFGAWNATNSTSAAGIYAYNWNFGDGATASGTQVAHQYAAAGVYPLKLTVTDNGNQTVTATQSVIVVAGNPPVAKITASSLSPEGAQPIAFSGDTSTSDHGIYLYTWFLPPRQFTFAGQNLDPNQWVAAYTAQNNKLTVSGQGAWGVSYFFSIGTLLQRGCTLQGQVDTPSTSGTYAMVGLKNLNSASGQYGQYAYAVYFENGSVQIYEYGSNRAQPTNYLQGTAYDVQIITKPGAGARYYLRPSGTGQPFTLIYDSSNISDAMFSFGADVYAGVWSFENFQVSGVVATGSDMTTPVYPGGTVTLQVVDEANLTNTASVMVTPVIGAPPVAGIAGPTNGLAGVQLAFNGYGSSDDYGIASYTWNFGDGSPAVFGPAVAHSYGTAGTYTNTLTVLDYAGQASAASLVVAIGGSNALVHVPWLFVNNVEQAHPIYAGKTNTLKAVARGVTVPFAYVWNYGDGSGMVTNWVSNSAVIYNLEATHAYTGGDGTPYFAGITLILTNGTVYQDTYPLLVQTKTLNIEEEVAIDEGLWYVHKTQTRYNIDTNTVGGYWSSIGTISATASSVQAFAVNGHLLTDDPSRDPYVETVQRGINYLLNNLGTVQIGPQPYGNPDSNNNGIGLQANSAAGRPIYETGPVIDAFVATARPELIAPTGGANVQGRAFKDIVQDMVDMFAWGQCNDPTLGGGWRYSWHDGPDNSASQWGAIGMLGAETFWGTHIPSYVKPRNLVWVNYSMDGTGFGYAGPGGGAGSGPAGEDACTPSALIQATFDGVLNTNALWIHGENYLANNWASLLANNNLYANYSIAKSMRTAIPQPVQVFRATGLDWFNDPNIGMARFTINHQAVDGSWSSAQRVDPPIATAWSILILSSSLFQQGPVAVITAKPNPTAIGYPTVFDGSSSYDKLPNYKIVEWRWIFNAANGSDFSHPDATGPIVTNVYGAFSTNTVLLEVLDNHTPQLSSVASVTIDTTIPPYPPTADAGGPYVACAGQDVHLDGSGSFCVDAANGNFIQAYDWEVNYQVPVTFNQGVSGVNAVVTNGYPVAGSYTIGLRVKNANSLVYTNFVLPDETADAFTTVYVYNRLIPDLKVRAKATKVQLTWTKAGDYGVIMRSPVGPDRGYVQVGQTTSAYATYLDTTIAYNTDYYYRVYAYQNGGTAPIGVSDAVFVHSLPRSFDEEPPSFQAPPLRLAKVGQLYEETLGAVSPQNLPLYFSLLEGPTNMTVNVTSGLVDFIPTAAQVGNIPLSFQVTNSIGRDVLSYTLFVFPASNPPPVIQINGPFTALTGQNIQFSSAGTTAPAGETLRYAWNFGDGSTSTDPNPVHAYGGIGNYLITLYVNNGYGITVSAQTRAVISRPDVPPVAVVSNGPSFTVRLGQLLTVSGAGSYSPLGNPITYQWFWGDGTSTNNAPSVLAHLYAAGGPYAGSLVVTDNQGEANTNSFQVTMAPANQPPVIVFTVSTNTPFIQSVVTFDATQTYSPSGDPMTFNWNFGDQGKTTGPLVTHVYQQIGNFTATLTVADNYGGVSVATQQLSVLDAPPVFNSTPLLLTPTGTNYSYQPVVTDAAGTSVTFQLVQGPALMSCDTNTGILNWLPGTNNLGPNSIDLRATDANGGVTDETYTLVVTTPLGPQIDLLPTHIDVTNLVADPDSLALSGTVRVYLSNNGTDPVPIPFTVSVFVHATNAPFTGKFATNVDEVVGYGIIPAGFPAGASGYVDMTGFGTNFFLGCPLYAYVDSQDVVPEYNKLNNLMRSGADLPTNTPPVVDFSASFLQVDRRTLPATALLTSRLGNSGLVSVPTNVPVAFYDGDPTAGGQLIGVAHSTLPLDPGMYQDLSVVWASPTITNHNVFVVADDPGTGVYASKEITYSNNTFSVAVNLAAILPPIAYAGQNQNVNMGDTVSLNGSGSSDPQGRSLTYQWSMLSIPIGSQAQLTGTNSVNPSFVADTAGLYSAQLVVNDGLAVSTNPAIVYIAAVNTNTYYPPSITSTPSFQGIASVPYTYLVTATDPQNKPLKFRLTQGPAGMTINTNTGLVQWTPTNSGNFFLQVAADGVGGSAYQGYTLTVIPFTNLPPQFTSTPVTTAAPNAAYGYTAVAVSPVNNSITYSLGQHPSGMSINGASGVIAWTPTASQLGANGVAIVANDGHGGATTQSFNVVVLTTGNGGPIVQTIPDQNVTAPTAFTSFSLDTYVSDPNYPADQITWAATGTNLLAVMIDSNRVATVFYPNGVNVAETITFLATDPAGQSAYSTPTFTVIGNAVPPVASIANLSATTTTTITTGTFNLLGTADDPGVPGVVAYQIDLYDSKGNLVANLTPVPVDSGGWHEGRVPGTGNLGTLDFTLLQNGSYTLFLTVQANGQTANASAQIAVSTPLKLGQLKFDQTDLTFSVLGAGLTLERTYDSLDLNAADFGYCWTFTVADLGFTVDDQRTDTQDATDDSTFSLRQGGSWDVTLTMPDTGRRVTFVFSLEQGSFEASAVWTPPPGINASLVPTCSSTLITLPGLPPLWQVAGVDTDWQAFDWPGFVLTLQNGTTYLIDRQDLGEHFYATDGGYGGFVHSYTGGTLSRITGAAGDHTDFVRNGVGLSNIVQYNKTNQILSTFLFHRDAQDRITAVYKPENVDTNGSPTGPASMIYQYDSSGNLASASKLTDLSGTNSHYATTTYVYGNPAFPHFITKVLGPNGLPASQVEYDSSGRVIAIVDALGHRTSISHDLNGHAETKYDALGNPTIYYYDNNGNTVAIVDALGNTIQRTFDAHNLVISEVDPLGHTNLYTRDGAGNILAWTDPLGNVTSYTYDANNNPTSITDPLGRVSRMEYDARGNNTALVLPSGARSEWVFDANGAEVQATDSTGATVQLTRDANGLLTGFTDPMGHVDKVAITPDGHFLSDKFTADGNEVEYNYAYNEAGKMTGVTLPNGGQASIGYDANGLALATTNSLGQTQATVYDANGQLTSFTDFSGTAMHLDNDAAGNVLRISSGNGQQIQRQLDPLGRPTTVYMPSGAQMNISYDAAGQVTSQGQPGGGTNYNEYDAAGRLTRSSRDDGAVMIYAYDNAGELTSSTDPLGHRTIFGYDMDGNLSETVFADNNSIASQHDGEDRLTRLIDERGASIQYVYNASGQISSIQDPTGNDTIYSYNEMGLLAQAQTPGSNTWHFTYDTLGNLASTTYPWGGTLVQTNNSAGALRQFINPVGQETDYGYDNHGNITNITLAGALSETRVFSANNLLTFVTNSSGVTSLQYDPSGRVTRIDHSNGLFVAYSYDNVGRLTNRSTPGGVTRYSYDSQGRMNHVSDSIAGNASYVYDLADQLSQARLPDGTTTTYTRNSRGWVTHISTVTTNGTVVRDEQIAYDASGNPIQSTEPTRTVNWSYDSPARVVSETRTGEDPASNNYAYDADWDLTQAGSRSLTFDGTMRVVSDGTFTNYIYDAAGRPTSRSNATVTENFTYDSLGRLIHVDRNGGVPNSVDLHYDHGGLLSQIVADGTIRNLLWDLTLPIPQLLEESDGSGTLLRRYVYGLDALAVVNGASQVRILHKDNAGNVRFLTALDGMVQTNYAFSAFGEQTVGSSDQTSLLRFAGEYYVPELGCYFLRSRFYDAQTGRFLTPDGLTPQQKSPQSFNPYLYALANPVRFKDPIGTQSIGELSVGMAVVNILVSIALPHFQTPVLLLARALGLTQADAQVGVSVAFSLSKGWGTGGLQFDFLYGPTKKMAVLWFYIGAQVGSARSDSVVNSPTVTWWFGSDFGTATADPTPPDVGVYLLFSGTVATMLADFGTGKIGPNAKGKVSYNRGAQAIQFPIVDFASSGVQVGASVFTSAFSLYGSDWDNLPLGNPVKFKKLNAVKAANQKWAAGASITFYFPILYFGWNGQLLNGDFYFNFF